MPSFDIDFVVDVVGRRVLALRVRLSESNVYTILEQFALAHDVRGGECLSSIFYILHMLRCDATDAPNMRMSA